MYDVLKILPVVKLSFVKTTFHVHQLNKNKNILSKGGFNRDFGIKSVNRDTTVICLIIKPYLNTESYLKSSFS